MNSFLKKLFVFYQERPCETPFIIPNPLTIDELCKAIVESWRQYAFDIGVPCLPAIGNVILHRNNMPQFCAIFQAVSEHNSNIFYQEVDQYLPHGTVQHLYETSLPLGEMFFCREDTFGSFEKIILHKYFPASPFV